MTALALAAAFSWLLCLVATAGWWMLSLRVPELKGCPPRDSLFNWRI